MFRSVVSRNEEHPEAPCRSSGPKTPGVSYATEARNAEKILGEDWGKQVWMVLDGRSRPWDICERWSKENGMAAEGFRLMAEGRMVGWNELAKLVGAVVQVLGNMHRNGEEEQDPWESDDDRAILGTRGGQIMGQRAVRRKNSSIKKILMEQCERDLESGGVMCWRKWMPSRRKNMKQEFSEEKKKWRYGV